MLAALRAQLNGRAVASPVSNFEAFASALKAAAFPVFAFSGASLDALGLEMLQGLVADLNKTGRASTLHLPASERGWSAVLASTWSTGFAPGIGFARGMPEYDPHRYDAARMIAAGEADLLLTVSQAQPGREARRKDMTLIALTKTDRPVAGAAVTIACGEPGIDHEAVLYTARHRHVGLPRSLPAVRPGKRGQRAAPDRSAASHGGGGMIVKIANGEIIDPTNGRSGVGDIWLRDGVIVDAPASGKADQTYDAKGCVVMAGCDRHPLAYRWRQCEHGAASVAGAAPRASRPTRAHASVQCRMVDLGDRRSLRADGLHHGGRASHVAGLCTAYPSRTRRHPDHRQGDARHSRQ